MTDANSNVYVGTYKQRCRVCGRRFTAAGSFCPYCGTESHGAAVVSKDDDEIIVTDGGTDRCTRETDHWQVVRITGVGIGEMWFDTVADELSRNAAETRASRNERHVAVPMAYSPDEPIGIGQHVDDYEREVVDQ